MILKFDHIAYSCNKEEISSLSNILKDYSLVFCEKNVKNLKIKEKLMFEYKDNHDIYLFEHKNNYPIEVTAYSNLSFKTDKYLLFEDYIVVNTSSFINSYDFYQKIGFKDIENNFLRINTIIGNSTKIQIQNNEILDECKSNKLDSKGFCCLAFITNNIAKEKRRLDSLNIITTDIMELELHKKQMNIFFAYNEYGDICEFIGLN